MPVADRPPAADSGRAAARPTDPFTDRTDYPLVVVTTVGPSGQYSGCLAGFMTQCSIDPPRFLVCISVVNHTFVVAEESACLAIHLLGDHQVDTASLFGERTGDATDKFSRCRWRVGATGAPILDQCAAWVEGTVGARFGVGDHVAFLLEPVDGGAGPCTGLLTFRSSPHLEAAHPATSWQR